MAQASESPLLPRAPSCHSAFVEIPRWFTAPVLIPEGHCSQLPVPSSVSLHPQDGPSRRRRAPPRGAVSHCTIPTWETRLSRAFCPESSARVTHRGCPGQQRSSAQGTCQDDYLKSWTDPGPGLPVESELAFKDAEGPYWRAGVSRRSYASGGPRPGVGRSPVLGEVCSFARWFSQVSSFPLFPVPFFSILPTCIDQVTFSCTSRPGSPPPSCSRHLNGVRERCRAEAKRPA